MTSIDALPTTPPTAADPVDAVVAAYQRFWDVYLALSDPPDPDGSELAEVATGIELATARNSLLDKISDGTLTRKPPGSIYRHTAEITTIDASAATLHDCAIDDLLVIDQRTGAVINSDVETVMLTGYLMRTDDRWKVSDIQEARRVPGEQRCDW